MVEVVKHLLGCCGEGHPNVFYMFALTPFIVFVGIVKSSVGLVILSVKNYLKRLYK
jgi:hypothetical protein